MKNIKQKEIKMKDKICNILGYSLLVIGLVGICSSIYIGYIGEKHNKEMMNNFEWDNVLETESIVEISNEDSDESENKSQFANNVIAIINVPKVDIRYPVVEGTTDEILKKSLGHFEGTALAGEVGNFCVAGHRNSSYARYFNRLDEVNIGDEIIVETRTNKYTYIVNKTFKIHESETEVLDQTDEKKITLITCTNGYKPKYRIVVQGILKED